MTTWNYIVVVFSVVFLAFLLWKEITRFNKARILLRVVATILSVSALACLAIQPKTMVRTELSGEAVLLTAGYDRDSFNNFLKGQKSNLPVFSEEDFHLLSAKNLKTVHVFGYGLTKAQQTNLINTAVVFHPSAFAEGLISIYWSQKIMQGQDLHVQGKFHRTSDAPVKLVLGGSGRQLDSVVLETNEQKFDLIANPSYTGRGNFVLTVLRGTDTVQQEILPVEIRSAEPLRVLILASSPDFENKFLINWLSKQGNKVMIRTAISRGKISQAFLNTSRVSLNTVSASLLKNCDLIIADAAELANLSTAESITIRTEIEQRGLGLVIRADSSIRARNFYNEQFPLMPGASQVNAGTTLQFFRVAMTGIQVPTQNTAAIRYVAGTQPLISDERNNILVNSAILGSGRLVYTTLHNTFNLQLSGNSKAYSAIWSLLLQKTARRVSKESLWYDASLLPREQEPVELYALSQTDFDAFQVTDVNVYPAQNFTMPFKWSGTYVPTNPGWHMIHTNAGDTAWSYSFSGDSWKTYSQAKRVNDTWRYVNENKKNTDGKASIFQSSWQIVPLHYFFIIFILSAAFLWIEKKLIG